MIGNVLQTLASYVPTLVVRRLVDHPFPMTTPHEEEFPAAVLFADFSGFTGFAEELARAGPQGAEELNTFLNSKFNELINLIIFLGGDVVTFAGDALLALWPVQPSQRDATSMVSRAAQCGLALQDLFHDQGLTESSHLDIRTSIGVGPVRMSHVGGVYERWLWLVTGEPVRQVMSAEQWAQPGDVVLSPEAWALVESLCEGQSVVEQHEVGGHHTQARVQPGHAEPMAICLKAMRETTPITTTYPMNLSADMEAALRTYIPDVVLTRLSAGQGNWLAELRLITVLFINLPDLSEGSMPLAQIQHGVSAIQNALYRYEGSVNKFSVDEKGASLIAVFGLPPLSHEDDTVRGVQAAMAVEAELHALGMRYAIGVTTGRAFCGIVGNEYRREYTILGDIVNLAARLMQAAAACILCDAATYHATSSRILFEGSDPLDVKGRATPVEVYRPREPITNIIRHHRAMVGRVNERSLLASQLQLVWRRRERGSDHGEALVLVIEGEAGMGKSRLVEELQTHADMIGIRTLTSLGDAVESSTPYYAWRRVFSQLLDLDTMDDPEERRQHMQTLLAAEPSLSEQLPLLNAVLPLEIPENEWSRHVSGQALADATRAFLLQILNLFLSRIPSVVIVENAHWLDSASWSLVQAISQHMPSVLLVIAVRPLATPVPDAYRALADLPRTRWQRLLPLTREETYELVCQRLGVARAPEEVTALIYEKAQGNPLFTEEMSYTLRDSGLLTITDGVCWIAPNTDDLSSLSLPDTIHSVITSRIDRLTPAQQLTLKVASVIGYAFKIDVLRAIYPVREERELLGNNLVTLEDLALIQRDPTSTQGRYQFKHVITQEVVYQLMPFAQRRQIHRALAEWYMQTFPERLEDLSPILAQHFAQADDERGQQYYTLAGQVAARLYANTEAIAHYTRALESAHHHHAPNEQLTHLYAQRGRVLELEAEYDRALENYAEMRDLAETTNDDTMKLAALMALATLRATPNPTFDPHQGEQLLEKALRISRMLGDQVAESKVLCSLMLLKVFTGAPPQDAIYYGEQSLTLARALRQREQVASILNDLAVAYRINGQIARSQAVLEEACVVWRELGNRPMLADNLAQYSMGHFLTGRYQEALSVSDEARRLSESMDNDASLAQSQFMMGHVYLELGQPDRAVEVMRETIYLGEQVGNLGIQIGTRADLGWVYGMFGDVETGMVLAELAYARSEEHNDIFRSWVMAVLARLFILKGDLVEAEKAVETSYQSLNEKNETVLAPIYVPLADAELALFRLDYARVVNVTETLLSYLESRQIRSFKSEALLLKSQALLAMGQLRAAREVLWTASAEDEALGAQRVWWQTLFLLSHVEARLGHLDAAVGLWQTSRRIVASLAKQALNADLRDHFLSLPHVRIIARGSFGGADTLIF